MICWVLLLLILIPLNAQAVTLPHAFAERNTAFDTTSTSYVDVTDLTISSGSLVAGKNYYIAYCVQVSESGSEFGLVKAIHGSTDFDDSVQSFARSSTVVEYASTCWFTVWTAVASEDVKVQVRNFSAANTVSVQFGSLIAVRLTDYLTSGTDYCFAESATDEALSTTADDGGSCTVTPSAASTWLAQTYSQIDSSDGTTNQISRMVRSGEASSTLPASNTGPESASGTYGHYLARVFSFGASSNTIKEQSEAAATAHTRLHSSVFLLNLSRFQAHGAAYTEAATSLTSTSFVEIQTTTITPVVTGDVWIGSAFVLDKTNSSSDVEWRVQVDGADQPDGQTTASLAFDQHNTTHTDNDISEAFMTVANLSNAAHTIDLDANRNTNSDVKYKQLWAVTFELQDSARRRPVLMEE